MGIAVVPPKNRKIHALYGKQQVTNWSRTRWLSQRKDETFQISTTHIINLMCVYSYYLTKIILVLI